MKKSYLLFFFAFLLSGVAILNAGPSPAKVMHITGQVVDSLDNTPLFYAAIVIKGTNIAVFTRDNGSFDMAVPSDTSTLVITYVGYRQKEIRLDRSYADRWFKVKMSRTNRSLTEVIVVSEKEKIVRLSSDEVSSVMMSPKLIAKLPNLGEVDVMRSFQLLPGISGTNESSSGLYVRGGTPDQNLILFDGMTIYHVDHFFGFFSAFNANTIDDIELLKGGFPAKYGGRLSSVMEVTGKPADMNNFLTGGGISLLSANAYVEVPVVTNKLSFQLAARRSYSDLIETGLYSKIFDMYNQTSTTSTTIGGQGGGPGGGRFFQQQQVTPTFHFYDVNSKLTWKPSEKDDIFVSFYNGADKLDQSRSLSLGFSRNGSEGSLKDLTNWGNTGVSSQWLRRWNENFSSHLFLSYSDYFNITDREYTAGSSGTQTNQNQAYDNANISNHIKDITFRFRNQEKLGNANHLDFGTEITRYDIKYSGMRTDTLTVNGQSLLSSFYLQDNISVTQSFHILAGYRGSWFENTSGFYSEPRISLIYNITKELKIEAASGKYYQFVSCVTQEDILQGNKDYWVLDNKTNVPVSSSGHFITGLTYEKGGYLFNVEGYYKTLSNILEESRRATSGPPGPAGSYNIFSGTGIARGVEFMAQKKFGNTTGWICYTLGSVIYNFPDLNYGKSFYADQDQTHEVKAVVNQTVKKWDFAATFVYATGKPYTQPESVYQLTMLDGSVESYYHLNDKNGLRLPAYNRIDIAVTYNIKGQRVLSHISVSVFNLLNHANIWYKEFNPQGYTLNITNVNYMGITPNISFSFDFK
ncbi:MAG TPA: TonB-dependent receptor [Bacteroidales bacterium]|nr:TonB-dependent receptor [Bacteroidales bacterium]